MLDALNFLKDKTLDYFEHNLTGLQPQPEIAREFAKRHKKDPNKIAFYEREIVYLGDQYFVGFYVIEAEEPLETKQYILARNLLSSKRNVLVDTSLG